MKYVILIHSNPQPWGHPTTDYVAEHQALPVEQREAMNAAWDKAFAEVQERGELVYAVVVADSEARDTPSLRRRPQWHITGAGVRSSGGRAACSASPRNTQPTGPLTGSGHGASGVGGRDSADHDRTRGFSWI